jgi:hypothetical protein
MHPTRRRRRPWPTLLLLALTALALAVAAVVLVAPPVGAHSLGGVEPSNYRSRVQATVLPWPGGRWHGRLDDRDDPDLPGGA